MNIAFLRTTALTLAISCLTVSAMSVSAQATTTASVAKVKIAQERLAQLGIFTGPVDGRMGELTHTALMDFQNRNNLPVTGLLTAQTYDILRAQNDAYLHGSYYISANTNGYMVGTTHYTTTYSNLSYNGYGYAPATGDTSVNSWSGARAQAVPMRFGAVVVNDTMQNGGHNVSVTLNGQPVLQANDQLQPMRVSHTYALNGEDAVIFTAIDGTSTCHYQNYLLTVRANGTYVPPQVIGNCSGAYQAQIQKNMLYISFPSNDVALTDTWRYGDNLLMRI